MKIIKSRVAKAIFGTLLGFSLTSAPGFAVFPDIDAESTLYYDAIVHLESKGTVVGFSDGTFRPEANISRGEFTKIIIETKFEDSQIDQCNDIVFPDLMEDNPHRNYICLAEKNNILDGYSDGEFKTDMNIEADQAAKIIVNSYAIGFGQNAETDLAMYVDQLELRDSWPATIEMTKDMLQRQEMAQIIYRLEIKTAFQAIVDSGSFESLEAAVKQAQLDAVLRSEDEYTIFAPNDDAFAMIDQADLNAWLNDDSKMQELKTLLLSHVVSGRYTREMLMTMDNQTIQSVSGGNLMIDVEGNNLYISDEANTKTMIMGEDMQVSNGVIFEIAAVLAM